MGSLDGKSKKQKYSLRHEREQPTGDQQGLLSTSLLGCGPSAESYTEFLSLLLFLLGFPGGAVGKNPLGMQKTQET